MVWHGARLACVSRRRVVIGSGVAGACRVGRGVERGDGVGEVQVEVGGICRTLSRRLLAIACAANLFRVAGMNTLE